MTLGVHERRHLAPVISNFKGKWKKNNLEFTMPMFFQPPRNCLNVRDWSKYDRIINKYSKIILQAE